MGSLGSIDCPVLLRGSQRSATVCLANHAAHLLHATVVTLSDPAMEEAFVDTPLYRQFAQIEEFTCLPDESTILRFGKTPSPRHRLEKHKLSEQMLEAVNDILQPYRQAFRF